ncbi:acyltransferase [Sphingopyxis sp.]|uniref:acyltransferase family protein n=1 Tax=Sphingopyxis sp. TaxID=1908224 RepID=UPI0025DE9177|nr:acyltransferase [Sphingopyxis sp.]MBK6413320.1 acyltransferase [Sphingopyxis sp.]
MRLDGLRGLAACFISFVFHLRILFSQESNPLNGVPGLGWFQHWGWSMVDLFFVLSGFVFAHCYLDGWRLRAGTTISSFALSRFARLWPLHAVSLACIILILRDAPETTVANAMTSLAMLHVFLPAPTQTLNGPAWSLSVEVFCYAVFILAATAGARALRVSAVVAIFAGTYCIFALGAWEALIGRGLLGFFCGVILRRYVKFADPIPGAVLIVPAALPFVIVPEGAWLILTSVVAWPATILLALRTKVLESRVMIWFGDRSYSIYLIHVPVYLLAATAVSQLGELGRTGSMVATIMVWILILLIADLFYRHLEMPSQKAILQWFRKREGGVQQPANALGME